ncbi:uncharacterized protein I206_102571 [Kwoniella pini CBS 10737]|uniref:Uncharacterized protein n=1 Tax=Kwoniella pini CBS 10737 TaxID=1296096 RepID=A0A1B9I5S2_9TREE|nr:uncharacterized protein I206_02922 [Kwoniella pini CBS 10737]OCF50864.1 hypothetical protein I206_02922 [Kwoniella pini CBS 10737]
MSGGIGLGLSSFGIQQSPSTITTPSTSVDYDTKVKSIHPAYHVTLPKRSHRGPRSLGVGKRFLSSPSNKLPPTIYDKSSGNPLSILSSTSDSNINSLPLNSPQMGLDLVNINPTQHLIHQMKKRSLEKRNFGLSSNDPLNRINQIVSSSSSSSSSTTTLSPTVTSSPTLVNSSSSPKITSSPIIPNSPKHVDMLGPSIALSIVLGLLVLGVASWVGIHYRRKRLLIQLTNLENGIQNYNKRRERDFDEKSFTSEMFNASNVVEKGLKPKTSSSSIENEQIDRSKYDNLELRSSFISYKRPINVSNSHGGRRVSFVDTIEHHSDDDGDHIRESEIEGQIRRHNVLPPPRFMVACLHQPNPQLEAEYEIEEGKDEVEDDNEAPIPSPRSSIAPTLEIIEEESEEEFIHSVELTVFENEDDYEEQKTMTMNKRESIISNNSSNHSSTCSADYTTASARSSISSLSALSIISSSFPQTPKNPSPSTPPFDSQKIQDRNIIESPDILIDSPTPNGGYGKFQTRRKRSQSQGNSNSNFVEIKRHDLLRTAVGRTMSLQPTKEVKEFIRLMTINQEEIKPLPREMTTPKEPFKNEDIPNKGISIPISIERVADNVDVQQELLEDLRIAAFISSKLEEKVTKDLEFKNQQELKESKNENKNKNKNKIERSISVPVKLLQSNKSIKSEKCKNENIEIIIQSRDENKIQKRQSDFIFKNKKNYNDENLFKNLNNYELQNNNELQKNKHLINKENTNSILSEKQIDLSNHSNLTISKKESYNIEEKYHRDEYKLEIEEEEEEDMEIEEEQEEEEEEEEIDSIWDPELYQQDQIENEDYIPFEEYYINFEENDINDNDININQQQEDQFYYYEEYEELELEEIEKYKVNYQNNHHNNKRQNHVPHIKVTSH